MIPREILSALRKIEIRTARLANQNLQGNYASSFKGQGIAFREVRPYQPGDDVRTIDWNVSARMNEPFVKVFVEEREMTVMLVVDLSGSEEFGTQRAQKHRVACEVSSLIAFSAIQNNDRVGLILTSDRVERLVPPRKGEKHVMRVAREILAFDPKAPSKSRPRDKKKRAPLPSIASLPPREGSKASHAPIRTSTKGSEFPKTDLSSALEALVGVAKRKSVAFIISDFYADGYERALALASAKHDVIPVVLEDPRDRELVDVGLATFEDAETGELVVVDTASAEVRKAYALSMRKMRGKREATFKKLGLDFATVETGGSFVNPLRNLFARRSRRAR